MWIWSTPTCWCKWLPHQAMHQELHQRVDSELPSEGLHWQSLHGKVRWTDAADKTLPCEVCWLHNMAPFLPASLCLFSTTVRVMSKQVEWWWLKLAIACMKTMHLTYAWQIKMTLLLHNLWYQGWCHWSKASVRWCFFHHLAWALVPHKSKVLLLCLCKKPSPS